MSEVKKKMVCGVVRLLYNGNVIAYKSFNSMPTFYGIIETWFSIYALSQPKKHEVSIRFSLPERQLFTVYHKPSKHKKLELCLL